MSDLTALVIRLETATGGRRPDCCTRCRLPHVDVALSLEDVQARHAGQGPQHAPAQFTACCGPMIDDLAARYAACHPGSGHGCDRTPSSPCQAPAALTAGSPRPR